MKLSCMLFLTTLFVNSALAAENDLVNLSIDRVDINTGEMVVNDMYYKMDLNIEIFDNNGKRLSRKDLAEGQVVNIELSPYRLAGHPQIKSIKIQSKSK